MYGRPIIPLGLPPSQDSPKLSSHLPFPLLAQIQDALCNIWMTYSLNHTPIFHTHPFK